MATWTDIPDSVLEPGKPARSVDALALRDNPIAIAEGASGAPRIAGQQGPAVHTGGIANSAVTAQKLATGGDEDNWVRSRTATSTAGAVGTYAFVTRHGTSGATTWNSTIAGSNLRRASVSSTGMTYNESAALSGTWRIMGDRVISTGGTGTVATLALRIS